MKIRSRGSSSSHESDEQQDSLRQQFYFQELPPDVKDVVLQGVKFRASKAEALSEGLVQFELDDLLVEEADDVINRHNRKRTIKDWLDFAERGE